MRTFALAFGGLGLLGVSGPALAQDCTVPCSEFEVSLELQNDWIFAASPSSLKSNIVQPTIGAAYLLAPTDYLALIASFTTESVVDPFPGEDAFFSGAGTYGAELFALLHVDPLVVRAGKFDTIFSLASEVLPGINADDLVSDVNADERWGLEATAGFEAVGINQSIAATLFTTDRTFLSESLFNNRGRTSLSDGGAGNTTGVSSALIAFNGCLGAEPADCYQEGDFGYRVGFRLQRAGQASAEQIDEDIEPSDEFGQMAAVMGKLEFDELTVRVLGEADYMRHFESDPDDALIVTGSAAVERGAMTYAATASRQQVYVPGEADPITRFLEVSAVYQSEDDVPFEGADWSLGAAYDYGSGDGEEAHALSVLFTLTIAGGVEYGE